MDRDTVDLYEARGLEWADKARPNRAPAAEAFGRAVPSGRVRLDIGCGAGRYSNHLGSPLVGLDAARTMLDHCRSAAPGTLLMQGDLEALPLTGGSCGGAWANMSYLHIPRVRMPLALADLHRCLMVGAPVDLQVLGGEFEGTGLPADEIGGRFFAAWQPQQLADVMTGAGFTVDLVESQDEVVRVSATRARTLADTVGPGMAVLVVGLNPSLYAADAGVGFARPGNRFWPAAMAAGLVSADRDAVDALASHRVGMTDVVKRATTSADQLTRSEYRQGLSRLQRLISWLAPEVVCMVGLAGWRAAVDPGAASGWQLSGLGGRPVYVMPSTSGANAHARMDDLTDHLLAVRRRAE